MTCKHDTSGHYSPNEYKRLVTYTEIGDAPVLMYRSIRICHGCNQPVVEVMYEEVNKEVATPDVLQEFKA